MTNQTPQSKMKPDSCLRDHKRNPSFARVAGTACLIFSMLIVVVTMIILTVSKKDASNISLIKEFATSSLYQFLGLTMALYGMSKLQESSHDKAALTASSGTSQVPTLQVPPVPTSPIVQKVMPIVEKVVDKMEQVAQSKQQEAATQENDNDDAPSGSAKAD